MAQHDLLETLALGWNLSISKSLFWSQEPLLVFSVSVRVRGWSLVPVQIRVTEPVRNSGHGGGLIVTWLSADACCPFTPPSSSWLLRPHWVPPSPMGNRKETESRQRPGVSRVLERLHFLL